MAESEHSQQNIAHILSRIDNVADSGFFLDLTLRHGIRCPIVPVECKNYTDDLGVPEIDQLVGRLNSRKGRFGVLICRKIADRERALELQRRALESNNNHIIMLGDSDTSDLACAASRGDASEVDHLLWTHLRKLLTS